jgi:hypothetical protein
VSATALGASPGDTVGDGNPGPTADGRQKPDLTGIGCGVSSALLGTATETCRVGPRSGVCATSWAAPAVAAELAVIRQQLVEGRLNGVAPNSADAFVPTGAMLRAIATNSAVVGGATGLLPSRLRGWGALNLDAAIGQVAPRILVDVRNGDGLDAGEQATVTLSVAQANQLVVTLTWTDPVAGLGADKPMVNVLALNMADQTGTTLLGNGAVGGGTPNAVNSTQMVVTVAAGGKWTVTVSAAALSRPKQGFALVVSGSARLEGSDFASATATVRTTEPSVPSVSS